jgi:hypothetical protein
MPRFVVEWEGGRIRRIWPEDEWCALPVEERPYDANLLLARDELEAYTKTLKIEEQMNNE